MLNVKMLDLDIYISRRIDSEIARYIAMYKKYNNFGFYSIE